MYVNVGENIPVTSSLNFQERKKEHFEQLDQFEVVHKERQD